MKRLSLPLFALLTGLFVAAGCSHLDVATSSDPNRVLRGTVAAGRNLPAGTEVVVRVIATDSDETPGAASAELTKRAATPGRAMEHVLGEDRQVLAAGTNDPVPFQIEYRAEDALLRHGVNVEARVSIGGQLRYRTISAHMVTLSSSAYRQDVMVQPVQ